MGREVLDRLAAPLMAGIYVGDPARLSIQATFPQLVALERAHGSLIRGLRRSAAAGEAGGGAPAAFVSWRAAWASSRTRAGRRPRAARADRRDGRSDRARRGAHAAYAVRLTDGTTYEADAVVLAAPGPAAARLLSGVAPTAARIASGVWQLSSATVSLGYRREAVAHPLDGLGVIVPRDQGVRWAACSWSSSKWDDRAPAGHVLVRFFYGGEGRAQDAGQDEAALVRWAREDAGAILGARGEPVIARAFRWIDANPQYDVGHAARAAEAQAACPAGLVLAGATWRGIGLPDCARQGLEAAMAVMGGGDRDPA
ncbi:MAG: FAD-dependent oxidoreductase [Anaerolineae bacterium]